MKTYLASEVVEEPFFTRTHYSLVALNSNSSDFVSAAAVYFIQNWMSAAFNEMYKVWQEWDTATPEHREEFRYHLDAALFATNGELIDDPSNGHTAPMATFAETMLRWLQNSFSSDQLILEPITPQPSGDGKIDLIEVNGLLGDYGSMRVTMWEVKSSDSVADAHNSKIYKQLCDYPRRFFPIANAISEAYYNRGDYDPSLLKFLRDMSRMALTRSTQVHYGVFIVYDPNIACGALVPNLHRYPPKHPNSPGAKCHHLAVMLVPNFKELRLEVWRRLHLIGAGD